MPILGGLFNRDRKPYDTAADKNDTLIGDLERRYATTFQPQIARATKGADLYANATGVNGPAGNTAATQAFQTSPGYQFSVDEALQGVGRAASAGGMLASGNHIDAAARTAHGLADGEYQRWLGNLFPFVGEESRGIENRMGFDTLTTTARMENNMGRADAAQAEQNRRRGILGNLLGLGARIIGGVAGGPIGAAIGGRIASRIGQY